jgi:hypothetical protein
MRVFASCQLREVLRAGIFVVVLLLTPMVAAGRCWITQKGGDGIGHQLHGMLTLMALHDAVLSNGQIIGYDACMRRKKHFKHFNRTDKEWSIAEAYIDRVISFACQEIRPTPSSVITNITRIPKLECTKHANNCTMLTIDDALRLPPTCSETTRFAYDNAWTVDPELYLRPNHQALVGPFLEALKVPPPKHSTNQSLWVVLHVRGTDSGGRPGLKVEKRQLLDVLNKVLDIASAEQQSVAVTIHTDDVPMLHQHFDFGKLSVPQLDVYGQGDTDVITVLRDFATADVFLAAQSSLSVTGAWLGCGRAQLQIAPLLGDWHPRGATKDIIPWPPSTMAYEQFLKSNFSFHGS